MCKIVVGPLGFVSGPRGDVSPLSIVSLRAISPFSFIFILYLIEKVARVKLNRSENSQLSSLRQVFISRYLERAEFCKQEHGQMPSMWQSEVV